MKSTQVRYDESMILDIKRVALKNGLPTTIPDLISLSVKIAVNCVNKVDEESFKQITGIKN